MLAAFPVGLVDSKAGRLGVSTTAGLDEGHQKPAKSDERPNEQDGPHWESQGSRDHQRSDREQDEQARHIQWHGCRREQPERRRR